MDLILLRHADTENGPVDLKRRLTKEGRKQAERVAQWLRARLPGDYELISSPAARATETAEALTNKMRIDNSLAPGAAGLPQSPATTCPVVKQDHAAHALDREKGPVRNVRVGQSIGGGTV